MIPRAIVTDIEGTTTSLRFVHDTLFPWSRARLADHVRAHEDELGAVLAAVRDGAGPLDLADCIATLERWHDEDRKIAPLKTLQGLIWADGYARGAFRGHVYPDAVSALRRWHARGIVLAVYSSGSVAAQRLLFGHSEAGDLVPLFSHWFDTATGAKRDVAAYHAVVAALGFSAADVLFLSDVAEELRAAREAGLAVCQLARDGQAAGGDWACVASFDAIGADWP